jgi:protein-L-isoaspartate(D-aspartate) O-methyltransferase
MAYIDFIAELHKATARDYLGRVTADDKAHCAEVALRWDRDYWDGDRRYGYGGHRYDGRWRSVAEEMARHYQLPDDASILDVGCGKAFLLYEFTQVLPRARVVGLDISRYAIENAKEEVRAYLQLGHAATLPYQDRSLILSFR